MSNRKSSKRRRKPLRRSSPTQVTTRPALPPLLYDRRAARQLLGGISESTIIRMETEGKLTAVKLGSNQRAKVFYTRDSVHRVAGIAQPAEPEAVVA